MQTASFSFSQPKAATLLVSMLRRKNPSSGLRSKPPMDGTMFLKMLRNGSDTTNTGCDDNESVRS